MRVVFERWCHNVVVPLVELHVLAALLLVIVRNVETKNAAVEIQWNEMEASKGYTWPSSCAIVNAALRPLSSMIAQLRFARHMVPSSAKPKKPITTSTVVFASEKNRDYPAYRTFPVRGRYLL